MKLVDSLFIDLSQFRRPRCRPPSRFPRPQIAYYTDNGPPGFLAPYRRVEITEEHICQ